VIGKLLVLGASRDLAGRYLLGLQVLHATGVDAPVRAPLVDVALRAAATSGATVRLLANQYPRRVRPTGGIAALLRYAGRAGDR
jgi:hypothetical protein